MQSFHFTHITDDDTHPEVLPILMVADAPSTSFATRYPSCLIEGSKLFFSLSLTS